MKDKEVEGIIRSYLRPKDFRFCEKMEEVKVVDLSYLSGQELSVIEVYKILNR